MFKRVVIYGPVHGERYGKARVDTIVGIALQIDHISNHNVGTMNSAQGCHFFQAACQTDCENGPNRDGKGQNSKHFKSIYCQTANQPPLALPVPLATAKGTGRE